MRYESHHDFKPFLPLMKWYMKWIIYELRICNRVKLWSSQLWDFCNCVEKPAKIRTLTGFEPVTSRYRCDALTNWAMKPLTLGAGHLWVLMVPWEMNQWWNGIRNESYMNCGYEIKWSYDLRSYESNFCNCVEKPAKIRTLTGFEPVTSRYRCDALTNWAMKPLTLGADVQTPLKSWFFQASLRNCKNCSHNCEDHSFTWFHIRSSYMIHFIYHFIIDSFLTGPLEPTNDQLPTSVAS